MSLTKELTRLVSRGVIWPFTAEIAAKVGEAIGDLIAWKINPPVEEDESPTD